jgi:hypothetical protein
MEGLFFQGSQKDREDGTSRATHRLSTACIEINRERISP